MMMMTHYVAYSRVWHAKIRRAGIEWSPQIMKLLEKWQLLLLWISWALNSRFLLDLILLYLYRVNESPSFVFFNSLWAFILCNTYMKYPFHECFLPYPSTGFSNKSSLSFILCKRKYLSSKNTQSSILLSRR